MGLRVEQTQAAAAKLELPLLHNDSAGMHSSELLLEAVTVCITHILNADSLQEALPDALKMIATVVRIDRMVIIENVFAVSVAPSAAVFFVWNSGDAPKVDTAAIIASSPDREALEEWLSPLRKGDAVIGVRRLAKGPMRDLMTRLQVVSMLQVPIMLNGVYRGVIVFDDCKGEHEWTRA